MKQIYNFEHHRPPILNENMIRKAIERRKLHLQTTLLVLAENPSPDWLYVQLSNTTIP